MYSSSQHIALKRTGRVEDENVMMWQEEGVKMLRAVTVGTVPDLVVSFLHPELGGPLQQKVVLL